MQALQLLRRQIQKALPDFRVPPRVMIMKSEAGRACPPTMAYEAPNHTLVVEVSKDGTLDAFTNMSSSNKFGYKVAHGKASGDSHVGECLAVFYYHPDDADVEPGNGQP